MKYRLIRMVSCKWPKKFWKRFYAREDLTIEQLGVIMNELINASGYYDFQIYSGKDIYINSKLLDEYKRVNAHDYSKHKYLDLKKHSHMNTILLKDGDSIFL